MKQNSKQTLHDFSLDNSLVIPETLHDMADAHLLMESGEASIFYKEIQSDLTKVEFLVNTPCLIYIDSGKETFISSDDDYYVLEQGEILCLPQNIYMISDFFREDGPLKSYLFFFDSSLVDDFLSAKKKTFVTGDDVTPCKIEASQSIIEYINALNPVYAKGAGSPDVLHLKMLELLHLIENANSSEAVATLLSTLNRKNSKRNIKHIMQKYCLSQLSVSDYATISGRSLSSFNREFRRLYNNSPKQWLIETRLKHARELVTNSEQSITDIAYAVGYENTSHFISLYKDKFGLTPNQARKKNND